MKSLLGVCLAMFSSVCFSGDVSIVFAKFKQNNDTWKVDVTLQHDDAGWDHFANEWRVVDESGKLLARRVLAHPHTEQPFTRSIYSAKIPQGITVVYVEAKDSKHGLSPDRVRVDLTKASGERYQVDK